MTYLLGRAVALALPVALPVAFSGALLAFPRDANAFCRTTTTPVPADYSPSRGCFTEGLPLFWKGACVGYSVNGAASVHIPQATATTVIDGSFTTWNEVKCGAGNIGVTTSNVGTVECSEVRYNPNGPNQNVVVFRDTTWPYSDPNNTLGLTTVTFNADTGEIYDADMELNATGKNLSTSATVPANGFDLLSVVTHEAGHFLGLAHATDASATMFASYKPGTITLRTLAADDIAGICEIYPNATTRNVAASVSSMGVIAADACDATPRHGFGSTCAENPAPADSKTSGCAVAPTGASRGSGVGTVALLGLVLGFLGLARRKRTHAEHG
jgi:MYXO-CTERM domain-containing protein